MKRLVYTAPGIGNWVDVPDSDCIHFGKAREERVLCKTCRGRVEMKTFDCAVHGSCTLGNFGQPIAGCRNCPDKRVETNYEISVPTFGIGDHLMALSLAKGWKRKNPDKRLAFIAKMPEWCRLFPSCYDALDTMPTPLATAIYPSLHRGILVENVAAIPDDDRSMPISAVSPAERYPRPVALAPIGTRAGRSWLKSHWLALESTLNAKGMECLILASGSDVDKLDGFRGEILAGKQPAEVCAALQACRLVISNESGIGHLGGVLGVPTIVLAAQLDAAKIYRFWKSVSVIQGPLPCGKCRWQSKDFRPDVCTEHCACLQAITPERVIAEVHSRLALEKRTTPELVCQ